ncbi:protein of unknown function DUF309 [Cyanobacterium stanieri PCC 7202]|uniref:DUF309 domain-containing protein n=1 Tax=Cyanobacterium stanieri (strain ATCC 29140 / PCC 7202) TaxID=292563 RepID=K9YKT8_CYASC|nr:protein of unknown function DUF309 [Cyanobacterium stanieri PCC 7202]
MTKLTQGIKQLNQKEFYACHDTLEEIWMEAPETEKKFYQGILQIAVGCYHLSNNNWRGAVILLGEGIYKLTEFEPTYYNLDILSFTNASHALLVALQNIDPNKTKELYQELLEEKAEVRFPQLYPINK